MRSSDIFLVSVVTSTRSSRSTRTRISFIRSSIWLRVSRTSTIGSTMPVGRTICSTTCEEWLRSNSPGVAETKTQLRGDRHELVERLRAVVHRAGQPEAVVDERLLARAVALEHAADLRHGLVRLVDEAEEVVGEVVDQAVRALARAAAVEDPRVVLDAVAEAHLPQHLHVVLRALAQAVGLEQLALGLELGAALVELAPDLLDRGLDRPLLDVVVRRRPDRDVLEVVGDELAGERVEVLQALDLVAEERRPERRLGVGREDLERLAAHAERAAPERRVVARVLDRDELAQQLVAVDEVALAQDLHVERRRSPASRGRRWPTRWPR